MSMITDIVDRLRDAGLNAHLPGMMEDVCRSTYYVVTDGGRRAISRNNGIRIFYVTAYVPADTPGALDGALTAAREAMVPMGSVRGGGDAGETDYDDEKGAIFAALEYTALCAI